MLVRESISFQRYKDPKEALGMGGTILVKNAIDHIFREDVNGIGDNERYTIQAIEISPTSKNFIIKFYSNDIKNMKTFAKVDKKTYAMELVKNSGIIDFFYDVNIDYKTSWWIVFHIKEECRKFFKPEYIEGYYYREKNLRESISFQRYKDPKDALGFNKLDINYPEESINKVYDYIKTKYTPEKPKWTRGRVGNFKVSDFYDFYFGIGNNFYIVEYSSFKNKFTIREVRRTGAQINSINDVKKYIDTMEGIKESISFQRYKDPKTTLFGFRPGQVLKYTNKGLSKSKEGKLVPVTMIGIFSEGGIFPKLGKFSLLIGFGEFSTSAAGIKNVILDEREVIGTYRIFDENMLSQLTPEEKILVKKSLNSYRGKSMLKDIEKEYNVKPILESISFQRYKDPKEALGLNLHIKDITNLIKKLEQDTNYNISDIKIEKSNEDTFAMSFLSIEHNREKETWRYVITYNNIEKFSIYGWEIDLGLDLASNDTFDNIEEVEQKIKSIMKI